MTDNDIIKALECCFKTGLFHDECVNCPSNSMDNYCMEETIKLAFDLINRQKAEIESLKNKLDFAETNCTSLARRMPNIAKAERAEAITEFAERLKKSILSQLGISTMEKKEAYYFCLDEIDQIANERRCKQCVID